MGEYWFIPVVVAFYFLLLILISYFTGRNSGNDAFFVGERKSPWYVVAYGMIGASLSGVTFISIPGWVGSTHFTYFQMVLGYVAGYYVIAYVLMPIYYRMNVVSIYTYLQERFGEATYKTGSAFFLLSRLIGASFRLFLVAIVFELIFDQLHFSVPFWLVVVITVLLIWVYTNKGGIKTIIWTDTLQTTFMLLAVILSIVVIGDAMGESIPGLVKQVVKSDYSSWFHWGDFNKADHFIKYFVSGALITISMTGLDQDMMQKNLSCKNIGEARKNMLVFSWILVLVNLIFLFLGAVLYLYVDQTGFEVPARTDYLYPMIALDGGLGLVVMLCFVLGLIASAYSSADSALTALTTAFSVDILEIQKRYEPREQERVRKLVHIGVSVVIILFILAFKAINNESVINNLMKAAGYTYGPLLGLYAFGILTKYKVRDRWVPVVAILSPMITFAIQKVLTQLMPSFEIGFELILINALLTASGLILLRISHFKKHMN